MKKTLTAAAIALVAILCYVAGRWQSSEKAMANTRSPHVLYWVDPMHPDYKSDHPGIAPDCGMELVPVYAEPATSSPEAFASKAPGALAIDL